MSNVKLFQIKKHTDLTGVTVEFKKQAAEAYIIVQY
jgi:hypothetical protein